MMIDYTKMAAFENYWANRKHWMSEKFQNFMDVEIVSIPAQAVSISPVGTVPIEGHESTKGIT